MGTLHKVSRTYGWSEVMGGVGTEEHQAQAFDSRDLLIREEIFIPFPSSCQTGIGHL